LENVGALLSKSQQSHIDLEFAVISSPSPPMLAQCSVRSLRQKHRGEIGSRRLRSMSSSIRDLHSHRPKLMIEKKTSNKTKETKVKPIPQISSLSCNKRPRSNPVGGPRTALAIFNRCCCVLGTIANGMAESSRTVTSSEDIVKETL